MALTITYTPGYVWQPGELLSIGKLNMAANPTLQLEGTITGTTIADNAVVPSKIDTSVAGPGLQGGGGVALSVACDGSTIVLNGNLVSLAQASVTLDKMRIGGFQGASAYMGGIEGLVPRPGPGQQNYVLSGDGTWRDAISAAVKAAIGPSQAVYQALNFI